MSSIDEKPTDVVKVETPVDFFESIGTKAQGLQDGDSSNVGDDSDERPPVEEIESLCTDCQKNGTTRMMFTSIPYFREIIIMSFSCPHCGNQNNEIQSAGTIQPRGTHYELRLLEMNDFSRQVIKADSATVKFIELDLEVPPGRGQFSNVEGLLNTVVTDLEFGQEARAQQQPEVALKVAEIISKGREMLEGKAFPFRVFIDDPAGNSFIAPDLKDGVGKWEKREYNRTPEQNKALGLSNTNAAPLANPGLSSDGELIPDEVYDFPATCPGCAHPCVTHMKMVDIPYFKQVVLMSTVCDACGYRSNDVKTGGEVPEQGLEITLTVDDEKDLGRDILKSETCHMACPELKLEVNPGTLGGRFTTVEGLLTQVRNDLHSQIFEGHDVGQGGDSLEKTQKTQWDDFFAGIDLAIAGKKPFTVVLKDPLASSYVQSLVDPPAPDPKIVKVSYTRSDEEEEDLGLKDMKTEGYEQTDEAEEKKEEEATAQ